MSQPQRESAMASGSRLRTDAKNCSTSMVTPGLIDVTPGQFTPPPIPPVTTKDRDYIREYIWRALSKVSDEVDERYMVSVNASDPSKVAAQVEAALFQFEQSHPRDDNPLEEKRPALLDGLRGNKDLRRQVLFGEITPEMLLNMSVAELQQKYPRPTATDSEGRTYVLPFPRERHVIRLFIACGLSKVSEEVDERYMDSVNASDPSEVATQVEAALFKHWGPDESLKPVGKKYSLLIYLINNDWIKDWRRQVLLGEITPEMLANMSVAEMQQMNRWPGDVPDDWI